MSEGKQGPFIATINAVLVDGGHDDITAIAIVDSEEDGELWFNANKPDDGTQVDYVLHDIETVFAAPEIAKERDELLIKCQDLEKHIHEIRPYSDCYKRVCESLGIEKDILGYVKKIKDSHDTLLDACKVMIEQFKKYTDFEHEKCWEVIQAKAAIELTEKGA